MISDKAHAIGFIGSSAKGLALLLADSAFEVQLVMCLRSRMTQELEKLAQDNEIFLHPFDWHEDFTQIICEQPTTLPFLIYQLDMLVPEKLCYEYRFFNIHRGDLYLNRGPNPDVWPILLGHEKTAISLHLVNEKIDSGLLIHSEEVLINDGDDRISVFQKLEKKLPVLIQKLSSYLSDEHYHVEPLVGGVYRPWVTEEDFTIDLRSDSILTIKNKIRSQVGYNGAILWWNNKKHYVTKLIEQSDSDHETPQASDLENVLFVSSGDKRLCFFLNAHPKISPPPKRPFPTRI
jgi:methionyl-tRNA formyltransferase